MLAGMLLTGLVFSSRGEMPLAVALGDWSPGAGMSGAPRGCALTVCCCCEAGPAGPPSALAILPSSLESCPDCLSGGFLTSTITSQMLS